MIGVLGFGCGKGKGLAIDEKAHCPDAWRAYPLQPEGTTIVFPDDEGAHYVSDSAVTMEWWYTIYHLKSETGREFSIMATFFMPQAEMAYRPFNVTDVAAGRMYDSSEWGTLEAKEGWLDLKYISDDPAVAPSTFAHRLDDRGQPIPFHYEQHLYYQDSQDPDRHQSLHLFIEAMKRPFIVGGDGYVTIGDSGDSYYYSLTDLQVSGELVINGERFAVSGYGWLDHQWGPFMLNPLPLSANSYEWMALHLDNGQQYMVSTIFDAQNRTHREEGFGSVGWMKADCTQGYTLGHTIERLAYWYHPVRGDYYAHKWHLVVPETGLDVIIEPVIEDQTVEFLGTYFYEGRSRVTGTVGNTPVTGLAFAELVHRYEEPELTITEPAANDTVFGNTQISWQVLNPDDGLPLTFAVQAADMTSDATVCAEVTENTCVADLEPFIGPTTLTVTASSVDGVISGSASIDATVVVP
jgi:predicted secreted hydrolase